MRLLHVQLVLLTLWALGDSLIVAAPAKDSKQTKLLVLLTAAPAAPHAAAAAIVAQHVLPAAVSTTSLRHVHNAAETTHTMTEIHHHALPHPASSVNGHSLGYGGGTPLVALHANLYTLHVGGFGVGLHVGGHGHGHGYFALI
ncbi:Hypothetical predicted protein [Cloeon dipterum]|uniref:Uncharacterized protein n=1 Tax=Cloeon dipterum TaxID=197152 RepID=A0A8S1CQR6_9INSE|nr:Hypothetical predicted protein [Cloeon dipterum]